MVVKEITYDEDENLEITKFNKYIKEIRHRIYKIHTELVTKEMRKDISDIRIPVFVRIYDELNELEKEISDENDRL